MTAPRKTAAYLLGVVGFCIFGLVVIRYQDTNGEELYARGFDGTRALEGLAPPEGPYPQWDLPQVRWGLGPVTLLEVNVPPPGGARLVLDARAEFGGQTMRFSVGGRRLSEVKFFASGAFERFEISLDLQPGVHEIKISHSHWREPSETDSRPLAVLFRTILLLPPHEGAGG